MRSEDLDRLDDYRVQTAAFDLVREQVSRARDSISVHGNGYKAARIHLRHAIAAIDKLEEMGAI